MNKSNSETRPNILQFRCKHRHSALSHPNCYLKFVKGDDIEFKIPKILVFDIETAPLKAFVFQKSIYKTSIFDDQVISEWFMLCWSAKWLFDDEVISDRLTGKEALEENDLRIVKSLWKLLDDAEIVIAHNGDSFDIPNMNTRFIVHNLPPTSPYQTIDTKTIASKQFGFTHNTLDALAKLFRLDEKKATDFELWKKCVNGDNPSLKYMEEYNKGDVELLEKVYLRLRPWIKRHPNLALYSLSDGISCPNCGSNDIVWPEGKFYYTMSNRYPLFKCSCGAYGRSRQGDIPMGVRKNTGLSIGR